MAVPRNFIVRIYRDGDGSSEELVGLVERVETGEQAPFHCFDELRTLIACEPRRKAKRRVPLPAR